MSHVAASAGHGEHPIQQVSDVFLRQVLTASRVGQLPLKEVPVLNEDGTIFQAVERMRAHSHGSILIVREGKLAGIFTERDLLKLMSQQESLDRPVSEVMTAHPRTVTRDDSLFNVMQLLDEGGYRRLPVVDADDNPVGLVDVKSVVHFLVEHFPAGVYNQAPRALVNPRSREGA
jgi:CBS domain-containing protein